MSKLPRVVITGMGAVTSLGNSAQETWEGLAAGKSGISALTKFNPEGFACKVASEANSFEPEGYFNNPKDAKRNDRSIQLAVAGSRMAVEQAGLNIASCQPQRIGVTIGTGVGGMESIEKHSRTLFEKGPRRMSPFTIPNIIANMPSGIVGIELGLKGPNFVVVSACASSTHAIGEAFHIIRRGDADVMITGGTEAAITPLSIGGFCAMKAMSTEFNDEPTKASRPFDAKRDGFVMGEGTGILVLETLEHAQARGANILAELVGYGANCDAFHMTSPDPEGAGLSACMEHALNMGELKPEDVNYINAHGTSTPLNDKFETMAIKRLFGEHAYNKEKLAISSTKSMTGHLLGAAGAVEAIASIQAIVTDTAPPTINLENADEDCDLDYTANTARKLPINVSISNNLGFGGHNATLVFKGFKA